MYDTGSYQLDNPAHTPFVPALANLQAEPNRCDPHGLQGVIPAALEQAAAFLSPGGQVRNFCDGVCDAGLADERPYGYVDTCDPLATD